MKTACQLIVALMICVLIPAFPATAQPFPTALSESAKAKFAAYDARIIAAIRESKSDGILPRDLPVEFPRRYGAAIFRDIFGSDWTPIREYADAALADLPVVDETARFAASPTAEFDLSESAPILQGSTTTALEAEALMATYRFWEPKAVANVASTIVLSGRSPEESAHNAITSGYVSQHLARTSWQGRDALVYYTGAWVVVFNYTRTSGGLIWATEIALYPR